MVAVVGVAWTLALVFVVLLAYAGLGIVALSYLSVPDESPYHLVEDLVFVLTLPLVLAVLLGSAARARRG